MQIDEVLAQFRKVQYCFAECVAIQLHLILETWNKSLICQNAFHLYAVQVEIILRNYEREKLLHRFDT